MNHERIPSGIEGLDPLIEGGLPRGSLIVLAGNPGTGKTVFGVQFLCGGLSEYGEAGVYVSFAEGRETLIQNARRHLGCDLERFEREEKLRVLDFATLREGSLSTVLEMILETIQSLGAKRLMIDSFSAMAQAFGEPIDARIVLHTILGKMVRQLGCTTILTVEVPTGSGERLGLGMEEFVADGVLILRRLRFDDRDLREIEIAKLRGTGIRQSRYIFTLHEGFHVFPPFEAKEVEEPRSFQPIPDSETHFSTGIASLDEVLGGGYRRGSDVLIEVGEDVPYEAYRILARPTVLNFLAHGRAVTYFLSSGINPEAMRRDFMANVGEDVVNRLVRFYVKKAPEITRTEPWYVEYKGMSLEDDYLLRRGIRRRLEKATGQPSLSVWGLDNFEATYGTGTGLIMSRAIAEEALRGNLDIEISKPVVRSVQRFSDLSSYHFKLQLLDGAVVVYLAKPAAGAYCLEDDVSKGYHQARLTPIV
ncbi:MAG: ATPase domain-containing protein [Candidatus Bathyarchaeia archaeon]